MSKFFYFKLAITNIKKNAKTYIPYMITSIMTICMFYIICSLSNNPDLSKVSGTDSMVTVLFFQDSMKIRPGNQKIQRITKPNGGN